MSGRAAFAVVENESLRADTADGRTGKGRPPMTERRKAILRLEIAREAVKLFLGQGVAATSGEQIADAVGISARTLWRYFPTKESCVQPLLAEGIDTFTEKLRSWPAGVPLLDHLRTEYANAADTTTAADTASRINLVRMCREEPGLRSVWLQTHHQAEPVFAQVLAEHLDLPADALEVRIHAGVLNAALRIAAEDQADGRTTGLTETIQTVTSGLRF
ncbi:TetR/AcrR family transcriptional regulator [Streptomyces sp. NPDC056909]|uniref:TetR/AcrR family transcriptional regulator n=1 Tax=Streptomyces sp. NPDC056909 TaxID=3345963 RepID=UPI0036CA1DAE